MCTVGSIQYGPPVILKIQGNTAVVVFLDVLLILHTNNIIPPGSGLPVGILIPDSTST